MLVFQLRQDLLGSFDDVRRHARQSGHVDAITFVGRARQDFVQKHDLVLPFAHGHIEVAQPRERSGQRRELVVVRGEKGAATDAVVQILDDRPG